MSRQRWDRMISSKGFYVRLYRKSLTLLWFSGLLNVLLILVAWLIHVSEPMRSYYATSGIIAPIRLTALPHPNEGATALLPSNQEEGDENAAPKDIPQ